MFGPLDNDELQCCTCAPEKRGHRERNLSEFVAPKQAKAMVEVVEQIYRVVLGAAW